MTIQIPDGEEVYMSSTNEHAAVLHSLASDGFWQEHMRDACRAGEDALREVETLRSELAEARAECERYEQMLGGKYEGSESPPRPEQAVIRRTAALNDAIIALDEAREMLNQEREDKNGYRKECNDALVRIAALEAELAEARAECERLDGECALLTNDNAWLQNEVARLRNLIKEHAATCTALLEGEPEP